MKYNKKTPKFLIDDLKKHSVSGNRKKYRKQIKKFGKTRYLNNGKIEEIKL